MLSDLMELYNTTSNYYLGKDLSFAMMIGMLWLMLMVIELVVEGILKCLK